jgi:ATP-dependent DNA ligase
LAGSTERPAAFAGQSLRRLGGRKLRPPFAPMEALSVDEIPTGNGWQYEPKWDGFRCLVFSFATGETSFSSPKPAAR